MVICNLRVGDSVRCDWRKYSKEVLLRELSLVDWYSDVNNVQNMWDDFECKLVKVVDKVTPLTEFINRKVKKFKINVKKLLLST